MEDQVLDHQKEAPEGAVVSTYLAPGRTARNTCAN